MQRIISGHCCECGKLWTRGCLDAKPFFCIKSLLLTEKSPLSRNHGCELSQAESTTLWTIISEAGTSRLCHGRSTWWHCAVVRFSEIVGAPGCLLVFASSFAEPAFLFVCHLCALVEPTVQSKSGCLEQLKTRKRKTECFKIKLKFAGKKNGLGSCVVRNIYGRIHAYDASKGEGV